MILQRHNITKLFVFIYLLIAVWPLRIGFDGGGSIAVVQMLVLFIIFTLAIANSKGSLRLSADFDSTLLLVMLLYAILNISIHGIFDSENIPSQQRSLIAILFIGLPFYISRNFINIDIKIVVKMTVYGLGLLMLYNLFIYYIEGRMHYSATGWRMVNQRDSVFINYLLLLSFSLIKMTRVFSLRYYIFNATFFIAFLFMLFSYSKGGHLLLFISIVSILVINKNTAKLFFIFVATIFLVNIAIDTYPALSGTFKKVELLFDFVSRYDSDGSSMVRIETWSWILEHVSKSIELFLFGTGNSIYIYDVSLNIFGERVDIATSESMYFDIILRNGFVGLIIQLSIFYRVIYILIKMSRIDIINSIYYKNLMVFFFGVFIFCIFETPLKSPEFGIFFYFMYGILVKKYNKLKLMTVAQSISKKNIISETKFIKVGRV